VVLGAAIALIRINPREEVEKQKGIHKWSEVQNLLRHYTDSPVL
jgi:hypothetical protein